MKVIFSSNTPEIISLVSSKTEKALETIGGMAESDVKVRITRNKSVVTGNLRNSITHKPENDHTVLIGTKVEYAPYVELGTSRQRAKPYLKPALEENFEKYKNVWEAELKEIK